MAPLAQFVKKVEFYHVTDVTSRGLELPKECMMRRAVATLVSEFRGGDGTRCRSLGYLVILDRMSCTQVVPFARMYWIGVRG